MWSDGRERVDDHQWDALASDIALYFAAAREKERQELQWENEKFRQQLRERAMRASA